jgi:hypothetical protein
MDSAIESELAEDTPGGQIAAADPPLLQARPSDRQVEGGAFLPDPGRSEIHRHAERGRKSEL